MPLVSGARLGPYEVLAPLGSGGMGEVYRARDNKLNRDVARKVLPEHFALNPDRLARFKREAQVLASLNHPNIAAIYGFEESDPSTGSGQAGVQPPSQGFGEPGRSSKSVVRALVLELVEGPTLADCIAQAPAARASSESSSSVARVSGGGAPRAVKEAGLALDEALAIARQIAEALEAAHEHGIIHRDLKPANVILQGAWGPTPTRGKTAASSVDSPPRLSDDIVVKVLDFGLAKAMEGDGVGSGLSDSPTITSPAATRMGVILGTAAYMSPEQARGKAVDKRTDVWAFGCVLYEMLAGKRAFGGDDVTDTFAELLKSDPDWNALPSETPPGIRRLLRRCLQKAPKDRLHDIADARIELQESQARPDAESPVSVPAGRRTRDRLAWRPRVVTR